MSHTPGKWRTTRLPIVPCIIDEDGRLIAEVKGQDNIHQDEANARLIAAAPDMLEVLEALNEKYEGDGGDRDYCVCTGQWLASANHDPRCDAARNAIAKAKGESE